MRSVTASQLPIDAIEAPEIISQGLSALDYELRPACRWHPSSCPRRRSRRPGTAPGRGLADFFEIRVGNVLETLADRDASGKFQRNFSNC